MTASKTINCVICGRPAVSFTGHVHKDKEEVIAGHCEDCSKVVRPNRMNGCTGCYGQWIPIYGYVSRQVAI